MARVAGVAPSPASAAAGVIAPVPPLAIATGTDSAIVPLVVIVPPVRPVPAVTDVTAPAPPLPVIVNEKRHGVLFVTPEPAPLTNVKGIWNQVVLLVGVPPTV